MKVVLPDWKLVLRPYPFHKNKNIYAPLRTLSNVFFDESTAPNDKFLNIKNAKAFLHFGTTMGYEAIYFDTPSYLLDIVDQKKDTLLHGFVHQYQNDKYLNTTDSMVLKNEKELINFFENLAQEKTEFHSNPKIMTATPILSLAHLAENLISILNFNNANFLAS